jgi:hypothetical protein
MPVNISSVGPVWGKDDPPVLEYDDVPLAVCDESVVSEFVLFSAAAAAFWS